jgi:hypothetical protein
MKLEVPNWNLKFTYNQITMNKGAELIPVERIQNFIFLMRGAGERRHHARVREPAPVAGHE